LAYGDYLALISWIDTVLLILFPISIFALRNWLRVSIEKRVQYHFDQKIESVRAELRKNEEIFKSDLRAKELEISTLRENVLTGRAQRQALLEKRRFEAVERVWASVTALAPYKSISATMAIIKFEAAAQRTPHDPNLRQFFSLFEAQIPKDKSPAYPAVNEQPFVSPLAWAYMSAYRAIIMSAFAQMKLLSSGIEEAGRLLNSDHLRSLLKAALPHQTEFIDNYQANTFHHLLDEIENRLLTELGSMLEGKDLDQSSIARSAEIMEAVKTVTTETAQQAADPKHLGS
jgi:hypothetical protein